VKRGAFRWILAATVVLVALALGVSRGSGASAADGSIVVPAGTPVVPAVYAGDVRDLPPVANPAPSDFEPEGPDPHRPGLPGGSAAPARNQVIGAMPSPLQNFAGLNKFDTCTGGACGSGWPPDINGEVGPNHYIEAVNAAYAIYTKTGTLIASFTENSLFATAGSNPCNGHSFGDPVVVYDAIADRWILSNFAFSVSNGNPIPPFYQCLAVSRSSDPVGGGWFLYAIQTDTGLPGQPPVGTLNDYGKFGIWSDCLYFAANGFQMPAGAYTGPEFASFSRSDMYAGLPLTYALGFMANPNVFTMIPSNLAAPSGATPPAGTPDYFVSESRSSFAYEVRKFTAGPNCGGGGTLSAATNVSQTSYGAGNGDIVPQPNTTIALDSLIDRLMQKVQYRKVGGAESLWVTHTVQTSGGQPTHPQWAQLNVTGGTISTTPVQQQIYNPGDALHRWMPSIAADKLGDAAMGFSTSNGTAPNFPSIAYAGRLAGDPPNQMSQGETELIHGGGSQTNNCGGLPCHRWGDYTAMSVDPVDGCTFWYTNEYYDDQTSGSSGNWHTRIGSFRFPSCGAGPTLGITKVADAGSVGAGGQIGYTVTVGNTGAGDATGVAVTDNLPAGTGVNWSIDAGNSSPGWSISGSPPSQTLSFGPSTLAAGASTHVHVISGTTTSSCGTYANTASYTSGNGGSGQAQASETVQCDTTPPTVKAPKEAFDKSIKLTTVSVKVSWSATDASGVCAYDLQESVDGGPFTSVSLPNPTSKSVVRDQTPGHAYQYRVNATDCVGNTSPYKTGTALTDGADDDGSAAISYSGSWTTMSDGSAWGGGLHSSTTSGASFTYTATGTNIAWVGTKGPDHGSADVFVDGKLVKTVNTNASKASERQTLYQKSFKKGGTHTLTVVNDGTAGHSRIDNDVDLRLFP
jgi:uncharacterized repeat protein (TIGR01451 family)